VNSRRLVTTVVVALSLGSVLAACAPPKKPSPPAAELPPPPPDQGPPPNSPTLATDMSFVTGLTNPWDMAFLPDGTMFFDQRSGPIDVRLPDGTINHIVTPPDVAAATDPHAAAIGAAAGMMGLTVHPNFASNRLLYACYTSPSANRVVRWTVGATLNGVEDAGTVLAETASGNQQGGCRIRFGPDGKLGHDRRQRDRGPRHRTCSR
jgi:aldose sugar dehydrogenase